MTTITEFLTARLNEDEAAAQAAIDAGALGDWASIPVAELDGRPALTHGSSIFAVMDPVPEGRACAEHTARHDPARVLREVAATRAILREHHPIDPCDDHDPVTMETIPCDTVRHLAAVHADHPDYRQEWAP